MLLEASTTSALSSPSLSQPWLWHNGKKQVSRNLTVLHQTPDHFQILTGQKFSKIRRGLDYLVVLE
jgi:hypothetical protein